MWLEALDDPKLTRLSLAERGAWWGLLKLAGKCAAGGKIISGGLGLDIDEIADALHIKTGQDKQTLESMMAKMEERGSLKWNNHALVVVHWEERQRVPPSARPEAVAKRVQLYRARRKEMAEPPDPREVERQNLLSISYRQRKKELGRDLTTEEKVEIGQKIDKELDKKYGG